MPAALPETIKALQIQDDKTVKVVEIPFASNKLVQELPANQVLVRTILYLSSDV
jgi:hypothetical protein